MSAPARRLERRSSGRAFARRRRASAPPLRASLKCELPPIHTRSRSLAAKWLGRRSARASECGRRAGGRGCGRRGSRGGEGAREPGLPGDAKAGLLAFHLPRALLLLPPLPPPRRARPPRSPQPHAGARRVGGRAGGVAAQGAGRGKFRWRAPCAPAPRAPPAHPRPRRAVACARARGWLPPRRRRPH